MTCVGASVRKVAFPSSVIVHGVPLQNLCSSFQIGHGDYVPAHLGRHQQLHSARQGDLAHAQAKRCQWEDKELREAAPLRLHEGRQLLYKKLIRWVTGGVKPTKCPIRSIPQAPDYRRGYGGAFHPQSDAAALPLKLSKPQNFRAAFGGRQAHAVRPARPPLGAAQLAGRLPAPVLALLGPLALVGRPPPAATGRAGYVGEPLALADAPDQGAEGECRLGRKHGNECLVFACPSEHCTEGRKDTEDRQLARLPVHEATLSYSGALRRSAKCRSSVAPIAKINCCTREIGQNPRPFQSADEWARICAGLWWPPN